MSKQTGSSRTGVLRQHLRSALLVIFTLLLIIENPLFPGSQGKTIDSDGSWVESGDAETIGNLASSSRYLGFYNSIFDKDHYKIGLAASDDLRTWTIIAEPIIDTGPHGAWDNERTHMPVPVLVDGVIYVFYNGYDGSVWKVGLAQSNDGGLTWNRYDNNPILAASDPWEDIYVSSVAVRYEPEDPDENKRWKMWYTGGNALGIGYAYSADGLTWSKYSGNPVLSLGSEGEWDDGVIGSPSVVRLDSEYIMFFGGAHAGEPTRTGIATFTHPEGTYTKDPNNPFLVPDGKTAAITQDVPTGAIQIEVKDATAFPVSAPVWVFDDSSHYLTTVAAHSSTTQVVMSDPAPLAISASGGEVRSIGYNGIGVYTPLFDNGWIFPITVYRPGFDEGHVKELTMLAYAPEDLSEIVVDYSAGVLIPVTLEESQGGHVSRENLHILDTLEFAERNIPFDPGKSSDVYVSNYENDGSIEMNMVLPEEQPTDPSI